METKKTNNVFWLILFGILVVGFTGHCFAAEKNLSPEEIFKQAELKRSQIKKLGKKEANGQSKIFLSFGGYWLHKVNAGFTGENISLRVFIFEDGKLMKSEAKNVKEIEVRNTVGEKIEGVKFAIKGIASEQVWLIAISMKADNLGPGVYRIRAIFKDGQESEVSEIKLVDRKIAERLKKINKRLRKKTDRICKACEKGNNYEENFKLLCKAGESGAISLLSKEERKWLEDIRSIPRISKCLTKSVDEAAEQLLQSRVYSIMIDCGGTIAYTFGKLRDKRAVPYLKEMFFFSDGGFSESIYSAIKKCGGNLQDVNIFSLATDRAKKIFKQAEHKRSQIESVEMLYEIENVETRSGKIPKGLMQLVWRKPNIAKLVSALVHKEIDVFDGKVQWRGYEEDSGGRITKIDLSKLSEEEKSRIRKMSPPNVSYFCCSDGFSYVFSSMFDFISFNSNWEFCGFKNGHLGKAYFLTLSEGDDYAKMCLGCKDGLIHKLEFSVKGYTRTPYIITLKKLNIDQPIPQERFAYQPPQKVKIKEVAAEEFVKSLRIKEENPEAFEKARQDALLSRCKSNIKQLLACIKMYAQDYDGRYPDKLSDLSIYLKRLDTFTCRATKDKITSKEKIDTESSYEYRGAGLTKELAKKGPQRIILIEKSYNHTINGKPVRCIGYAGGHVRTRIDRKAKIEPSKSITVIGKNATYLQGKKEKEILTLDALKNAEYCCFWYSKVGKIRLKNGVYEEHYAYTASVFHVGIYKDKVAFGDLNNDGREDAVVVIDSYAGGSGHFYELAIMINQNGIPKYLAGKKLGDRVIVNSVIINKAGKIIVDMIAHGPNDAMCCPTVRKIIEYKLYGHTLIELGENRTADNIDIDIEQYLHKNAIINGASYPPVGRYGWTLEDSKRLIPIQEAILFAIKHLKKKAVGNIKICETRGIVAPFGAYFIDGKGDFSIGKKPYSTFRIGVRDGTEDEGKGRWKTGDECLFIARGIDNKGKVIWYPEPGPDFRRPAKGELFPTELLVYEFMYGNDRVRFESLSDRFK